MIKNYLKIAYRNLFKNKTYNAINILGLAMGLASFILLLLYLNYELSYDKWDAELNKVYRVSLKDGEEVYPATPTPLASFIAEKYPNCVAATSIQSAGDVEVLFSANNKKIYQKGLVTVDSSFFEVFPYKLLDGDATAALQQPKGVIISQELSEKVFGKSSPIGKPIQLFGAENGIITGVLQKLSMPSHFTADIIMIDPFLKGNKFWGNYSNQTYIKLIETANEGKTEEVISRLYYNDQLKKDNLTYEDYQKKAEKKTLFVDAIANIHNFPKYGESNIGIVSVLMILAVLLLLAGSINFSNLAIAKSISRAKEVGVRKVLGSDRNQLIIQFMSEAALQCLLSLVIAGLIVYQVIPYFKQSFNIQYDLWQNNNAFYLIGQMVLCLSVVTLFSGLYPSLFLSKFNTSKVLKGDYSTGKKGVVFRNSLIVLQFMVSAFFIIATLVVNKQMHYMQTRDKGFSEAQVLRIPAMQKTREEGFATMRNQLLSVAGVSSVSKSTKTPWGQDAIMDTSTVDFKVDGKMHRMASVKISADYFNTLQIPLIQGRYFTEEMADQNTRTAVLNETAAKMLLTQDPLSKTISFQGCDSIPMPVVGVVKDINVRGFESVIQPIVYTIGNNACMYQSGGGILVKLNTTNIQSSIEGIEQVWKTIEPETPLRYTFLDENFQKLFTTYIRLQKVIAFFTSVAILISMMGLFALTAFLAKQQAKQIGIRKVLGASVTSLTFLLSKDFIRLVIIAIVIMLPIAWWTINQWLQTFAYRINLNGWIFLWSALIVLVIATATVSFQAIKAAITNPVKSLRTE